MHGFFEKINDSKKVSTKVRENLVDYINEISIWFIIIALSALGIKTNLQEFSKVSFSYSVILVLETLFLLISALVLINVLDI